MALSARRPIRKRLTGTGATREYPVAAATTIYEGDLVMLNSSGYAIPGADTASCVFVGVAKETVINSGSAGAKNVEVYIDGDFSFEKSGTINQASVGAGSTLYLYGDATVALAATTSNDIPCGKLVGLDGSDVWVAIRHSAL